jgi:glycosyltransferase involved in cell wall biosynthesis
MSAEGRPLKVALIHAADHGGGAERSTVSLHEGLRALGHESRLHVGYRHLDVPGIEEIERVPAVRGVLRGTRWVERTFGLQNLYAPGFRELARTIPADTDVVHVHSIWGSANFADIATLATLGQRFPLVLTLRDEWMLTGHCACTHGCERWRIGCGSCPALGIAPAIERDGTRMNFWRKARALEGTPVQVTAVSEWLSARARVSPIFRGKTVTTVYNGIDVRTFKPGSRDAARAALGIPADATVLLLAGQSIQSLRVPRIGLLAMNALATAGVTLLLVGRGAEEAAALVDVASVAVPFRSRPEEMAECFRAADLTVVTSEVETFGRIAAESLACGTPVVTFATGGLPEVVTHGETGLVVPVGDAAALAAAVDRLLRDPAERARMSAEAVASVARRFETEVVTRQYVDIYRKSARAAR